MALGLLPAAIVIDLALPSIEGMPVGIGEALGCSGGPNLTPDYWYGLNPERFSEEEPIHTATDGFFVISATGANLSLETAKAQVLVVVRDDAGAEVPGDVSVLADNSSGASSRFLFGWAARQPLPVGARFTATLALDPSSPHGGTRGGEFPLVVDGEPTPLPVPEATFDWWHKYYRGDGLVDGAAPSCLVNPVCATPYTVPLPPRVTERLATMIMWTPPPVVGHVAWAARVELRPGQGELLPRHVGEELFFGTLESSAKVTAGSPLFSERAERYCVDLVIEDLRTGLEQRSELCSAPGPLMQPSADSAILRCSAPPSAPELARVWCEVNSAARDFEECPAPRAENPTTTPGDSATPPDAGAAIAAEGARDSERALLGCSLGASRQGDLFLVSLAGLAGMGMLRRRHRR